MADEDADKQVPEPVEEPEQEAPQAPETKKEETPPETEETEAPETQEPETESQATAEEEVEEDPPQMSRRKAKRLEKLEGLVEHLKKPDKTVPNTPGINYREMIDADPEVLEQLETKSAEYGQNQYNAGLEQAKSIQFHTRLEIDAPKVESKYSQFNKESPDFDPYLADYINRWYLQSVGYDSESGSVSNEKLRYSEFVDGLMEVAESLAGQKVTKTASNIARQAATTGLRPDGSSASRLDLTKSPEDMTDEELQAAVEASMPTRDARGRFLAK